MLKANLQEFNFITNIQSFVMKNIYYVLLSFDYVIKLFFGQNTDAQTENLDSSMTNDTIRIANDTLEYEVIIIDPGFSTWLASRSCLITRNLI
jgi:hypothetical protein